ncbi:MAG TPA: branched-chain amino acid ABC transporter permease [Symbiobacteriaceae bacterium]|nr:branched-chain amino acid ABC transporter permease [Symbiobacteriaceae bacterium]
MFSSYELGLLSQIGINILLGLSVYVILSAGQLSLGNAGFMALGAYTASVLTVNFKLPLTLALVAAGLVSSGLGFIAGFPALRLTGIYLSMVTLGFGQMIAAFFLVFAYTGAERGFFGMLPVKAGTIWAWTIGLGILTYLLERSKAWLGVRAVEDDEFAAQVTGLNTTVVKLSVFAYGAALAGVAGGLYAHFTVYIEPHMFTFSQSVMVVLFVVFGGSETIFGPVLGAIVLTLLPEALRFITDWRLGIYGALLIVLLMFRPQGILTRAFLRRVASLRLAKRKEMS